MDRVNRFKDQIEALQSQLSTLAFGLLMRAEEDDTGGVPIVAKKPPTIPKPFNITKPRPREIPEPIRIPLHTKSIPAPDPNATTLKMIADNSKKRQTELLQTRKEFYETNPVQEFVLGVSSNWGTFEVGKSSVYIIFNIYIRTDIMLICYA